MKILVTGAAGFIATNLVPRLIKAGHEVHGVDNFFLGKREFVERSPEMHFHEMDLLEQFGSIEAAFAKANLGKSQVTGSQIRIPRGKKELYLAALADGNALPADFYKYLDDAINLWLDTHPDIDVKLVTTTTGLFDGKFKDIALVVNVWY